MRKSTVFFLYIAFNALVAILLLGHAVVRQGVDRAVLEEGARVVRDHRLTDLALFTEARYTRHISQADLNTPFQDYPLSFEHFPSGSLVSPPLARGGSR